MPDSAISEGISSVESIDYVTILEDPHQMAGSSTWILKVRLQPDGLNQNSEIPAETDWFVHLDQTYPSGSIKIYPSRDRGITATYPHQRLNVIGDDDTLWREGNICVAQYGHIIGRSGATGEPLSADERLPWYLERAVEWLEAASKGELRREGEPFELPDFDTGTSPAKHIAYNESPDSLNRWAARFGEWGLVNLVELAQPEDVLLTAEFRDANGDVVYDLEWGDYVTTNVTERISGAWVLVEELPIEPPWEVPETWGDLERLVNGSTVDLFQLYVDVITSIDEATDLLLLGFPIPNEVGGPDHLVHWQPIDLSDLRLPSEVPGFRETPRGNRNAARAALSRCPIQWLASDNWGYSQLSRRGHLHDPLRDACIMLIGAGALGSTLAENLVRDGCRDLIIVDDDTFEIGNIARHSLTLHNVGENKADALAARLNSLSPHADVVSYPESFPPKDESLANIGPVDIVIDCSGSDAVLRALESHTWEDPVLFCSASMGRRANRLYYFAAYSHNFPFDDFREEYAPWRLKEQVEWNPGEDAIPERVGCWHPASVIEMNRVQTWVGTIARLLEGDLPLGLSRYDFKVLETQEGALPVISQADPPFLNVDVWTAPESGVTVEVPPSCLDAMTDLCTIADSVETGGILAGTAQEAQTARIIRASDPPRDSTHTPTTFHRGSEGIDEWLREAQDRMGIHYLGEWHYHPSGSSELSEPDRAEMEEIAADEEYGCPHPIIFVIGQRSSEVYTARAYLFHRDDEYEELKREGPKEPSRPTRELEPTIVFPNSNTGDDK